MALEDTGERFIPGRRGASSHEHWHRYCSVVELAVGKDVLDLASGEGYGSAMLAEAARSVVGVDIDYRAVAHARRTYAKPRFVIGRADRTGLDDASFDLVVSFETLEHLHEQTEMLAECKRVLRPGGVLIISTPNKRVFSDLEGAKVEFHVKELYDSEFIQLVFGQFKHFKMYCQNLIIVSAITPFYGDPTRNRAFTPPRPEPPILPFQGRYMIAACSDDPAALEFSLDSLFYDVENLIVQEGGLAWKESPAHGSPSPSG